MRKGRRETAEERHDRIRSIERMRRWERSKKGERESERGVGDVWKKSVKQMVRREVGKKKQKLKKQKK